MRLKQTDAGWVVDPAGEAFDVLKEGAALVYLRHPTHGFIVAIPKAALAPPEKKKEQPRGPEGGKA